MSTKNFVSYGDAETLFTGVGNKLKNKVNQSELATVETTTTASKAYSAGEYLVVGGVLCKATTSIAQGATIVTSGAGKNADPTTAGAELNELNSNLTSIARENLGEVYQIQSQLGDGADYYFILDNPILSTSYNRNMFVIISGSQNGETRLDTAIYLTDGENIDIVSANTNITLSTYDNKTAIKVKYSSNAWVKPIIWMKAELASILGIH